ncbi:MAG: hypothetical protein ACD_75C01589G0001 [uncultured bacterium]|nr:MAG: hypothetical protein ACD_75C01589G0001 [uncultured bacterium]
MLPYIRKPEAEDMAQCPAQHGADEERWGEDAAGIAGTEGKGGGERLEKDQRRQDPQRGLPVNGRLDEREARAVHVGNGGAEGCAVGTGTGRESQPRQMHIDQPEQSEKNSAHRRLEQLRKLPVVEGHLGEVQHPDEHDADQGGDKS